MKRRKPPTAAELKARADHALEVFAFYRKRWSEFPCAMCPNIVASRCAHCCDVRDARVAATLKSFAELDAEREARYRAMSRYPDPPRKREHVPARSPVRYFDVPGTSWHIIPSPPPTLEIDVWAS